MNGETVQDLMKRPVVLQSFRDGWAMADDLGLEGERVAHGLANALEALEGTEPVGSIVVVNAEALRKVVSVALSSARTVIAPAVTYLRKMGLLEDTGL